MEDEDDYDGKEPELGCTVTEEERRLIQKAMDLFKGILLRQRLPKRGCTFRVNVRGFGTFKLYYRKGGKRLDPRNGSPLEVPERLTISFKISRPLLELLNTPP